MKKIFASLFVLFTLIVSAFAQSVPQTMSYQAVVRDANGQLYANKTVSVTISILKNNALGDAVYTESQNVPTNANGLMSLEFGNDADFATIDWANGPYFIKTETNVNGTIIEATSQLLSVPYAKYAETAGNVPNMDEYVKKSDWNEYIDKRSTEKICSILIEALSKAYESEDTVKVFYETIDSIAHNIDTEDKNLQACDVNFEEKDYHEREAVSEGDLLGYVDCGVAKYEYDWLVAKPSRWTGEGGIIIGFIRDLAIDALVDKYEGTDALKNVMMECLENNRTKNNYDKWVHAADEVFTKDVVDSMFEDLLEQNYSNWSDKAKQRLGNQKIKELMTEWVEENYDTWEKTARKELGDKVVDEIYNKLKVQGINNDGSVIGVFSVSDTKTIRFSRGNLQYQGSSKSWRFAEYQFDAVAGKSDNHSGENGGNVYVNNTLCDNINVSSSYSGWIDLFAWGTSGKMVVNGDSTYTAYLPYSISGDASDYYYGKSLAGTVADWGVNMGSQWRTLTTEEWDYLYQGRADAANKIAYATITTKKTVNKKEISIEVPGIVLLPDNWAGNPTKCNPFSASLSFTANKYTEEQWYAMQATGAVFLPASGVRKISDKSSLANQVWLTSTKTYAAYWTADAQRNGSALAYWFVGSNDKSIQQQPYTKTAGMCVRLVTDNN